MPTKISLALGPRQTPSRQVAWGCFTTNLTLPGFGTLLAGRITGYFQVAITLVGFALSLIFTLRFFAWYLSNHARLEQLKDEPERYLLEMWHPMRWAVLGIGLFAVAWLWSLASSMAILSAARKAEQKLPPPLLKRVPPRL